jgi:proteasome lid subunit RPN8/RPN11
MENSPPTRPPTATELCSDPVVQAGLESAWNDSKPLDPDRRHEEGGWIYMNLSNGQIAVRRAPAGQQSELNLDHPPHMAGHIVVGVFHTHPNPSAEGWQTGPSEADRIADERDGVPDLIRADDGIHVSGPQSRRGGLAGGPVFPVDEPREDQI